MRGIELRWQLGYEEYEPMLKMHPLSLQVLFSSQPQISSATLLDALNFYDSSFADSSAEIEQVTDSPPGNDVFALGSVSWQHHNIAVICRNAGMPSQIIDPILQSSHWPPESVELARSQQAHVLLEYRGNDDNVLEQYIALSAVAGALEKLGATTVVNANAHVSCPIKLLMNKFAALRELPLLLLYCGFVKYDLRNSNMQIWMRTHGANFFAQPDLGVLAERTDDGNLLFAALNDAFTQAVRCNRRLEAGSTFETGDTKTITVTLREPTNAERSYTNLEYFGGTEGELLVAQVAKRQSLIWTPRR